MGILDSLTVDEDDPEEAMTDRSDIVQETALTSAQARYDDLSYQQELSEDASPADNSTTEDDTTSIKIQLNDEDTDMLKDFLHRTKASKAAKIAERASVASRRDSDVIKAALASPRQPLETMDAIVPSPRKAADLLLASSSPLANGVDLEEDRQESSSPLADVAKDGLGEEDELASAEPIADLDDDLDGQQFLQPKSRRSGRVPKVIKGTPSSISIRRQGDDNECIALKKSQAQETALVTRNNTRRNKGASVHARVMLMRLKGVPFEDHSSPTDSLERIAKLRWNDDLVAFFDESKKEGKASSQDDRTHQTEEQDAVVKPRARRSRTLGATNGTPAKPRMKDSTSTTTGSVPLAPNAFKAVMQSRPTEEAASQHSVARDVAADVKPCSSLEQTQEPTSSVVPSLIAPAEVASTSSAADIQPARQTKRRALAIPTPMKRKPATNRPESTVTTENTVPSFQQVASTKPVVIRPVRSMPVRYTRQQAVDKENAAPAVVYGAMDEKSKAVTGSNRSVLPRRGIGSRT